MTDVKLIPIEGSSAITHYYYDADNQKLHLLFTGAKQTSVIEKVDAKTLREFLASESKGRFFHSRLK